MIIPVDEPTIIPILIVDLSSNQGAPGLSLEAQVSVNGAQFEAGPSATEIGAGWYALTITPTEPGFLIVTADGGAGLSTWRDIIEVWPVEPSIPVRYRSIRTGLDT